MKLTPEEFEAWREAPMTRLILDQYVPSEMVRTRETHDAAAWEAPLDSAQHSVMRERYETLEWLHDLTFEELHKWLTQTSE